MPKVGHTSLFDYKNRITDLESEVNTLKRRLDELRRAKMQAFYKQRRSSKSDIPSAVEQVPCMGVLEQRITRLQNELELAELKYVRDTKELKETIERLQEEMNSVKENHQKMLNKMNDKHLYEMAKLKRGHTEELALYSEKIELEKEARVGAEKELVEYKCRMRSVTLQLPDVEVLKSELTRLQDAYYSLKLQHESEVSKLEERIAVLMSDIAAHGEKSKRRFQLIPDRTYIVKKTTPTASSTSIGSALEKNSQAESNSNKSAARPKSALKKSEADTTDISVVMTTIKPVTNTARPTVSNCQAYNSRVETIDRPKSTTTIRPKSSLIRKTHQPVPPEKITRPKSCWSDQRGPSSPEKRVTSSTVSGRFGNVSSKIDTGRGDSLPRESKHRLSRNGSPWQTVNVRTSRSYVARSSKF